MGSSLYGSKCLDIGAVKGSIIPVVARNKLPGNQPSVISRIQVLVAEQFMPYAYNLLGILSKI